MYRGQNGFLVIIFAAVTWSSCCCFGFWLSARPKGVASSSLQMAGLFGEQEKIRKRKASVVPQVSSAVEWLIYVDQSTASLEKGGRDILEAFICLANPQKIQVLPALLLPTPTSGSSSASSLSVTAATIGSGNKASAPLVKCIYQGQLQQKLKNWEIPQVDSMDKVYRILTHYLQVPTDRFVLNALQWKAKGKQHGQEGKYDLAAEAFGRGIQAAEPRNGIPAQQHQKRLEGSLRLLRATVHYQQAQAYQMGLQRSMSSLQQDLQSLEAATEGMSQWMTASSKAISGNDNDADADEASLPPWLMTRSVWKRMKQEGKKQESKFRQAQYRHGLYQFTLLQAAQDALQVTELLPNYAPGWCRAAEILSALWQLDHAKTYYERAIQLEDPYMPTNAQNTTTTISSKMKKDGNKPSPKKGFWRDLQDRKVVLEQAQAQYSEDRSLRLALDVAVPAYDVVSEIKRR